MRRAGLLVAALTVAAFVLRVLGIDQSLFGDEVFTYDIVTRHGLGGVLDEVHRTSITPPLHYVLAWASVQLGDPTETIRLPSLIAGTATVPAIWLLGRATVGEWAGVVGAALAAFSPFAVYYGQEARTYALLVLLVTLSTLGLVRALQTDRRRWWALFVLSSAAALYSHYTAVFPLAAQFGWAVWTHPKHRRQILLAHAATAALWAPWLPFYLDQRKNEGIEAIGLLNPLSARSISNGLIQVFVGHPFLAFRKVPGTAGLGAAGLTLLLLTLERAVQVTRPSRWVVLLGLLALAAPVGEVAYSLLLDTIYAPRSLLPSLPAAVLVLGSLVTSSRRLVAMAATACATAALGVGLIAANREDARRPPWRQAAAILDAQARPKEPIAVLAFLTGRHPQRRPALRSLTIFLRGSHARAFQFSREDRIRPSELAGARRAWVVSNQLTGLPGVPAPPELPGLWRVTGRVVFPGFSDVVVYRYEIH